MDISEKTVQLAPVDDKHLKARKKRRIFTTTLLTISLLTVVLLSASQASSPKNVKLNAADVEGLIAAPNILSWNPFYDPNPTPGKCVTFNYNVILLFDRSPEYLKTLSVEQMDEFRKGVKRTFDQISLFANARGGHARVILGAYATYTVWQNMPAERLEGTAWDATKEQAWKDSIDISVAANLAQLKQDFDDIYSTDDPVAGNSFSTSILPKTSLGYTGGEPSREFWATDYPDKRDTRHNGWGKDNMHDALVQSAREISRWAGGKASVPEEDDIDLVLLLTSGQPNVNNGVNQFPSKAGIETNPPLSLWTLATGSNWYSRTSGPDDIFRAQDVVGKIRSGQALSRNYVDPNEGTADPLIDSLPAYDGPRPRARVFGQAIIGGTPAFDLYSNEFLHMAQIFGEEFKDYSALGLIDPPTGDHRHWDKTVGKIKSGEILSDMTLTLRDGGCPPPLTEVVPKIQVVPKAGAPLIDEGESGTVYAEVVNVSPDKTPLENVEIWINSEFEDNVVTLSVESTAYLGYECGVEPPEWIKDTLPKYSCHTNKTFNTGYGKKPGGGTRIKIIERLEWNERVTVSYPITTSLGSTSADYPIQVWGHGLYDFTSRVPKNDPDNGVQGGYTWGQVDVGFNINPKALPA